jgi:ATP-dependent phosphoenolpyruvate carboxykinase
MITAALNGDLDTPAITPHPVFGMGMPVQLSRAFPQQLLNPANTWPDPCCLRRDGATGWFTTNFQKYAKNFTGKYAGPEDHPAGSTPPLTAPSWPHPGPHLKKNKKNLKKN